MASEQSMSLQVRAICQCSAELVMALSAADLSILIWTLLGKELIGKDTIEYCQLEVTETKKSNKIVCAIMKAVSASPHLFESLASILYESGNTALVSVGEKLKQTCESLISCHSHSFHTHPPPPITPRQQQFPICRYANYLRAVYKRFELSNPACSKWMCSPGENFQFINLAVISKEEKLSKEEAEKIKKSTIHGQIDIILKKKDPIAIENILQVRQEQTLSCVLIEGAPGIGKSTLACEVCRRWGRGELFQEYSIVQLVTLRDERVQRAKCVVDLFCHSNKKLQEEVVQEIGKGKGILLLLEGLDELPKKLITGCSFFTDLLSGVVFPEATVLVTSRPSAINKLWKKWWQKISRHIEILGFTKDNIDEYTKNVLSERQLLDFNNYLSIHPHIKSMMYVPLHCAVAITVYLLCQQSDRPPPKTLTGLYKCLAQTILIQYLQDHPDYKDTEYQLDSFSDLPSPVYSNFKQLCNLAFYGVNKQQLVFHSQDLADLPLKFEHFGFMNAVPELFLQSTNYSYNFLHLSVQEYLAAYHVSLMCKQEQEQLLQTVTYDDHRFNMTRFLAGITQLKDLKKEIIKKVIGIRQDDSDVPYGAWNYETEKMNMSNYTLEFLYECQDVSILDHDHCYKVNIQSTDSAHHLTTLGYCIANSSSTWYVTFTERDNSGTEVLWHSLKNCTSPTYRIEYIKFKNCDPDFILKALKYLPECALVQIEELSLKCRQLPPCLSEQVMRMNRLTTLTVDDALHTSLIHLTPALSRVSSLRNVEICNKIGNFEMLPSTDNLFSINVTLTFIDQFLLNLPQQTVTRIGSLKIQHLHEDYQHMLQPLPPCLPGLISRMERLNTLKLVNIDSSLTQLLPTLQEVSTLRNLTLHKLSLEGVTLLHQWLYVPSCQLEMLTLYEEIGAKETQKVTINFSTTVIKTIKCQYSTKEFIDQIAKQLLQMCLVHIKEVILENTTSLHCVEDLVHVYKDRDEKEYEDDYEYEDNDDYEYEDNDDYEYEDDNYEYEYEDNEYWYEDEYGYGENESTDEESAHEARDDERKAGNEEIDRDQDDYQLLSYLLELIPRMERLNTLKLLNSVPSTSLTELLPVLSRIPTLKNLEVNSHFQMLYSEDLSTGTIKSVGCTPKSLDHLLLALPQQTIADIEVLAVTYGDKCRCSSYEVDDNQPQHCLADIIPRMRLNTLTLTNVLDASLTEIIPALHSVLTLRDLTLHKLNLEGITCLCQWLPTCQLEKVTIIETLETHKVTIIFCNNFIETIECDYITTAFANHILTRVPQQLLIHIKTLTVDNENYRPADEDDYGIEQLEPPISIPSSLHELIPRMEKLNTLTLKSVLDTSLTELIPKLSKVPTLRNLTLYKLNSKGTTLLCQWLPTCQLKTLKLYETILATMDMRDEPVCVHTLITITFCDKCIESIECLQCTTEFISQILTQIPLQCTTHVKTITIDNRSEIERELRPIPPCILQYIHKMERVNTLTLMNVLPASLVKLIPELYNIPSLSYLTLSEVNSNGLALLCQWLPKCQLQTLKILDDNLGNVTINKHLEVNEYQIECQYRDERFIDQILTKTLPQCIVTLVINNYSKAMYYEEYECDNNPLPIPPSLPELIPRMEKLTTLTLKNVTDTSLTELIPALSKVPTLKNLALPKLKSEIISLLCQYLPTYQLHTLNIQEEISNVMILNYYNTNRSIEAIECQCCTTELIEQMLTQIPQQSFTQVKALTVCSEEGYDHEWDYTYDPQALPVCLPKLIPIMERLNTLLLKYILDVSLAELMPILDKLSTLRNLTLYEMNSEGIALLCQWLPTCQLESLTLPYLSPNHIGIVSRAATKTLSLKTFNIHGSNVTSQCMQTLASMLKHNQSLTELNVSSCKIDSDGVCCLAEALHHNTTLKKLIMSENSAGEKGALAVAEMLKHNTALEELDLSHTHISSDGFTAIDKALHDNIVLKK